MRPFVLFLVLLGVFPFAAVGPISAHGEDDPFTTDLIAGPDTDVGAVLVWNDDDYLYVKYTVEEEWCLGELHLHVAAALEDIPQTKSGNPIPGHFDFKAYLECASETTFAIPLAWATDTELYIAAKAEVMTSPGPDVRASYFFPEGAWGAGTGFPGKNWATYFTYTVQQHMVIGWANLQWPPTLAGMVGTPTDNVYGQVWIDGVTSMPGPTPGLRAQLGFGPEGTNPDGSAEWTWIEASFNVDAGNNDEFVAQITPTELGVFDYVYRYTLSDGAVWLYADLNGPVPTGEMPSNPGKLTVTEALRTVTITFNVTVPEGTPAEALIYIAGTLDRLDGDFPQWDPGGVFLTKVDDYQWTITFTGLENTLIEYKYTMGYWDFVEKGASCEEIANRQVTLTYGSDGTQEVYDTVLNWRNIPPCDGKVMATFNVTVPDQTPAGATVYIAGSLGGFDGGLPDWDPSGVPLTKVGDFQWRITLTAPDPQSLQYKYTMGAWDSVEKGPSCEEIPNRGVFLPYGNNVVPDTVLNWANIPPCGASGPVEVTFNVTVPDQTPAGATVYIAGSLGGFDGGLPDWDPSGVPLTKVGDFQWRITLTAPDPQSLQYKYTMGAWDSVEKGPSCEEIPNRGVFLPPGSTVISDTVVNWGDTPPCGD